MDINNNPNVMPNGEEPGKGKAIASLVLGIIAVVFWFFGWGAIVSIICGIVGIILASMAKKDGNTSGIRTGGLVCSIIGLVGGAFVFVACVACAGLLAGLGTL